jgi:S1-C subfamily serine protease
LKEPLQRLASKRREAPAAPILDDLLRKDRVVKPLAHGSAPPRPKTTGKVVVMSVTEGGPAAKAGMRAGDVISDVQDGEVEDLADFYRKLGAIEPAG